MAGFNKAFILGRVVKKPEVRVTGGGQQVANFSVAVNERLGKDKEKTTFFNCVAWGTLGELCGQYLDRGREVMVEGRLDVRQVEKDGQKRTYTDIVCRDVQFLSGGKGQQTERAAQDDGFGPAPAPFPVDDLDSMPF
jgi:single-strand DNA-binding protein